jgi:four helix bundle protein
MSDELTYQGIDGDEDWVGVAESSSNPIREKSFSFALVTVDLYKRLQADREFVISKQLLRSGTSVGANVEEASAADSRKDFIHKMALASKEARESKYWLRLLSESGLVPNLDVSEDLALADELVRLLTSIVKSASGALESKR